MRLVLFLFFFLALGNCYSQSFENVKVKTFKPSDSLLIDSLPIQKSNFKLTNIKGVAIDTSLYTVDYVTGRIYLNPIIAASNDSLRVQYLPFPKELFKGVRLYDPSIILSDESPQEQLVQLIQPKKQEIQVPFNGLQTSGSISRGLRIGNNQNSVVDAELDLRITGKLNDKVSLRASIQDANVPQTQNGYSQRLDEFDQIFIELYSDSWKIRAGDVDLEQQQFAFNKFTKRVQGISGSVRFDGDSSNSYINAAGALVRGTFNTSRFVGQEGNQGPYKLTGQNGELFILIVSGSERVYVNGILLQRGENNDYVIDYNAGEVRFTPTFPITSEMRISIEYQYSERNFTRFVGYGTAGYQSEKLNIEAYAYTESDAKNQPLQQNLSEQQVQALAAAGDNPDLQVAPSAIPDDFSENKILYRRDIINGVERFVFSQDPNDDLFTVRFTLVGDNQGDYVLINDQAIANIYEYVAPVNGVSQGNYAPIVRLFAPQNLTITGVKADYAPSEKTQIATEFAASRNDLNKFSNLDDDDNDGVAGRFAIKQVLIKKPKKYDVASSLSLDYINENFRNVERIYNIEFARDWNLVTPQGNQLFTTLSTDFKIDSTLTTTYSFQHLEFSDSYNGNRHVLSGAYNDSLWQSRFRGSVLKTSGTEFSSKFNRYDIAVKRKIGKNYIGTNLNGEGNEQKNVNTDRFTNLSQRFNQYEIFAGRGDTTKVFVELGYRHRVNDSLRDNQLVQVNKSNNYYIRAQPIKDEKQKLLLYANYRKLKATVDNIEDEVSFNSRVQYQRSFYDKKVNFTSAYETNSASIARQDFTYVEVNPGQGTFTWIDYNNDGIQDLNEFEVAQFQDQANYVRVLLPNQLFVPTHQNKLALTLNLNPSSWNDKTGYKRILSHFFNQTSYQIDRMIAREGTSFSLNPFNDEDEQLGLNKSFRNSLFFNRGKQDFTTNYTYISTESQNLQSIGLFLSKVNSHQLGMVHRIKKSWLIDISLQSGSTTSLSENFENRNFKIDQSLFKPKLSYLFSASNQFDLFYQYQKKENKVNDQANLEQHNFGVNFSFNKQQAYAVNGTLTYIKNDFEGQAFSPAGFQILEGLQDGDNLTWQLLFQRNITSFLDLNLSYNGRATESAPTVHTGSVQLKAYF